MSQPTYLYFTKGTEGLTEVTTTNPLPVSVNGSAQDLRGLATNRPAANAVTVGTTYWSVDTNVVEVSNGTAWVVI